MINSFPKFPFAMLSAEAAQRLTYLLCGCAVALSSAEYLAAVQRLDDRDILSWRVGITNISSPLTRRFNGLLDAVLDYHRFKLVLIARLLASLAMIVLALLNLLTPWPVFLAFLVTFLIGIRSPFGLDGAHQMNIVILCGLFVSLVSPAGSLAQSAGLWFIAAQSGLSYLVAGTSKLSSTVWRDGSAPVGIFSTDIYGNEFVYRLLKTYPPISRLVAWSVVVFECSFVPLCLLGPQYAMPTIAVGLLFHFGTAVSMGLNTFLASFVAAYPAVWYVVMQIHK